MAARASATVDQGSSVRPVPVPRWCRLGDVLSRTVFHSVPGYLAFTFPIGTQRIVPFRAIAIAFGAGLIAALLATGQPLLDAFSRGDLEAVYDDEPGEAIASRARLALAGRGAALVTAIAVMVALAPVAKVVSSSPTSSIHKKSPHIRGFRRLGVGRTSGARGHWVPGLGTIRAAHRA